MTALIVHAHPEPTSLTRLLVDRAVETLTGQGQRVLTSDLYAMGWKSAFDAGDFPDRVDPERLSFILESEHAFKTGRQSTDVTAEQAKLLAADLVIFAFPLWWFGMPAILKGWVDRVFAYGLAYGYGGQGNRIRYGEGGLAGRRAMLCVTVGGPEKDYGPRGINGPLDQLLFPITHGTLFYPGMQVLPTHAVHGSTRLSGPEIGRVVQDWQARLAGIFDEAPIAFRRQNGGDYPDGHQLGEAIAPGEAGLMAHLDGAYTNSL